MNHTCKLIELDFEKMTATFNIPDGSSWFGGNYNIEPVAFDDAAALPPTQNPARSLKRVIMEG